MRSSSPLKPVEEEFADLVKSCDNIEDLSRAELAIEAGLHRLGRALLQGAIRKQVERETSHGPGDFPP